MFYAPGGRSQAGTVHPPPKSIFSEPDDRFAPHGSELRGGHRGRRRGSSTVVSSATRTVVPDDSISIVAERLERRGGSKTGSHDGSVIGGRGGSRAGSSYHRSHYGGSRR